MPNHIEVPGALRMRGFLRKFHRCIGQQFLVTFGYTPPLASPCFQMSKLHTQHGALNAFHAVIETDFVMIIALGRAVIPQGPGPNCKLSIIRYQRSALATRSKILARIKTEARNPSESPYSQTTVLCSMGLGSIFDERDIVSPRNLEKRVKLRW